MTQRPSCAESFYGILIRSILSLSGVAALDSITNILRDILCTAVSLDDGLSVIQNQINASSEIDDLTFEISRAIEEILLRRPSLANIKFTELLARLFSQKDRLLPDLLSLMDTRYTCAFRRSETEILPDIEALPILIDMLGELAESISLAITLNLRPLLSFLTDEMVQTLEAIYTRDHPPSTRLAINEAHYIAHLLMDETAFDCAEALMTQILEYANRLDMRETAVEIAVDNASVLTEIGLYNQAREILETLEKSEAVSADPRLMALVRLQVAINETRDDTIDYKIAREHAEQAIQFYKQLLDKGMITKDEVGSAYLTVGSSILATGWREAVREAIEWLEAGAKTYESTDRDSLDSIIHYFKCLAGLGLAYGMLGDYDNVMRAMEYLEHARSILNRAPSLNHDISIELARCDNAAGWICLLTESSEFWPVGEDTFIRAIETRQRLVNENRIPPIELLSSKAGLAMLQMLSTEDAVRSKGFESLYKTLSEYIQLTVSDSRAYVEMSIVVYNIVCLGLRHNVVLPQRLQFLLEDIDRMLSERIALTPSVFTQGALLVMPLFNKDWALLKRRATEMCSDENCSIASIAWLMRGLATAKINADRFATEPLGTMSEQMMNKIRETDQLLAEYWNCQSILLSTIQAFYQNKDYSHLAAGLNSAAIALKSMESSESTIDESIEFIRATASTLARTLFRFSTALQMQCGVDIKSENSSSEVETTEDTTSSFILPEDWLGLIKIIDAYVYMIEQAEPLKARPYLNAVFVSITRALRMLDSVALSDRRVLAHLTREMNRRFYLRS